MKSLICNILAIVFLLFFAGNCFSNEENRGEVSMINLSNGMKVLVKKKTSNNILAVGCFIDVFAANEKPEKRGVTNLLQRLLLKGTKKRSAFEIAEDMESIGGSINASASNDYALQCGP